MENKINSEKLVELASAYSGMGKKDVKNALDALIDTIEAQVLINGATVSIVGFGKFYPKNVAAHEARNPINGEAVSVPACTKLGFKASKTTTVK